MLEKIKIVNFKGISSKTIFFNENVNVIVGNNGVGKTNILEAIGILFQTNFFSTIDKKLVRKGENLFYLEGDFFNDGNSASLSLSYDAEANKKNILLNKKKVTKKILNENSLKVCYFLPITMNLFYLGPKYRREFLDEILANSFPEYLEYLKEYEKVLKSRNKILKNICEGFSQKDEIIFWDEKFIYLSKEILKYRINLINYIKENIKSNTDIFGLKVENIDFVYNTKVDLNNIEASIKEYLNKNLERDIIIGKTQIGPHLDDFDIILDSYSILNYASRGEIKSIIISLKLLELDYVKLNTGKTPIFLIDDFSSELDEIHIKIILNKISQIQMIITSISELDYIKGNYIFI